MVSWFPISVCSVMWCKPANMYVCSYSTQGWDSRGSFAERPIQHKHAGVALRWGSDDRYLCGERALDGRYGFQTRTLNTTFNLFVSILLPPANEVAGRWCFYTCLSVILFTGGCLPYTPGQTPLWADTPLGRCLDTSSLLASAWNVVLMILDHLSKTSFR